MKKNKVLFLLSLLIISLIGGLFMFINTRFRLASLSPSGTVPTYYGDITYKYNRVLSPLNEQPQDLVEVRSEKPSSYSIHGDTLVVTFSEPFDDGEEFIIKIRGIRSVGGEVVDLSSDKFTAKYIEYKDLSKEQQEKLTNESVRSVENNPFLDLLPYQEVQFKIEGFTSGDVDESNWAASKDNYCIVITTFAGFAYIEEDQFIEETVGARNLALAWITEQGVDPSVLNIDYRPKTPGVGLGGSVPPACTTIPTDGADF